MAKIKGPLMSADARGNWAGGTLQCRGGLHGTHVYRPTSPGSVNQSPASAAQAHVRARYAATLSAWRQLSAEERAAHNAAAEPLRISGWNLYLQSVMTGQMHQTDALLTEAGQIITTNTNAAIIAN